MSTLLGSPALLQAAPAADAPKSIPVGVLVSRGTVAQVDTPTLNFVLARQATGQELCQTAAGKQRPFQVSPFILTTADLYQTTVVSRRRMHSILTGCWPSEVLPTVACCCLKSHKVYSQTG
jgi:hypothetical protein